MSTIEHLTIREPLVLQDIGKIFWGEAYRVGLKLPRDFPDTIDGFNAFSAPENWVTHYLLPCISKTGQGVTFGLTIFLDQPYKTDGYEYIDIELDGMIQSSSCTEWISDWETVPMEQMKLPAPLLQAIHELFVDFIGREMTVNYCCLPEEGNPNLIHIQISGRKEREGADATLTHVTKFLNEAIARHQNDPELPFPVTRREWLYFLFGKPQPAAVVA